MVELFWIFFIGGAAFALITVLFGDFIQLDHLDFLQPIVLVSGLTAFGGAGILLERYSPFDPLLLVLTALMIASVFSTTIYFLYVKRMKDTESSTGYSINELEGTIGEVVTTVPANGYGEVIVSIGMGVTNQIAASYDGDEIKSGTSVVVVEVKDDTLYVARLNV